MKNLSSVIAKKAKTVTHRVSVDKEMQVKYPDGLVATTSHEKTLLLCFREIPDEEKRAVMLLATALASCE